MPLDPALKAVLDQMSPVDGPKPREVDPEQIRAFLDSVRMPTTQIALSSVDDRTIPGPAGPLEIRIYRPHGDGALPVLLFIHGGGWVIGGFETHDAICRALANGAGCVVVAVDYRLAPEHRYPAAVDDCYATLEWLADNAEAIGVDASRIAVGGDSVGGNLAAVVSLMARDRNGPAIIMQLLVCPVIDADFETRSYLENAVGYLLERDSMIHFWDQYVPDPESRAEAHAAPLRADDLSGLPRALVLTAEFDPLRDEGEAYARALEAAGVPTTLTRYDGMVHGFFAMSMLVESARQAIAQSCDALKDAFGTG